MNGKIAKYLLKIYDENWSKTRKIVCCIELRNIKQLCNISNIRYFLILFVKRRNRY